MVFFFCTKMDLALYVHIILQAGNIIGNIITQWVVIGTLTCCIINGCGQLEEGWTFGGANISGDNPVYILYMYSIFSFYM